MTWLSTLLGDHRSVMLLALGAVFLTVLLLVLALLPDAPSQPKGVERSLRAVESLQAAPRPARDRELERPFGERVVQPLLGRFTSLARRFTPERRIQQIRARLDLAGNPSGWDADRILGLKALGAIVLLFVGAVIGQSVAGRITQALLGAVAGAVLGWFAPTLWIYQVGYDRTEALGRALPDAIDLLTISVESGLAFDAALSQVARNTEGPIAGEFHRVLQEMQIGTGRLDALRAMADRTNIPELRSLVGAMVQADSFGIPIANVLRVQSRELRMKRTQKAEAAAQKVPVKILFPLIFCILPSLFVVILAPVAITLMTTGFLK